MHWDQFQHNYQALKMRLKKFTHINLFLHYVNARPIHWSISMRILYSTKDLYSTDKRHVFWWFVCVSFIMSSQPSTFLSLDSGGGGVELHIKILLQNTVHLLIMVAIKLRGVLLGFSVCQLALKPESTSSNITQQKLLELWELLALSLPVPAAQGINNWLNSPHQRVLLCIPAEI